MNIDNIYRKYIKDEVRTVTLLSGGHINKTYLIETDPGNYICQCINKCMDIDLLETNYRLYSEACERNAREYPKILKSEEGSYFVTDNDGDRWRMYPAIEGEVLTNPLSEAELYECGRGLAKMHEILSSVSAKPDAVYPHLHDLEFYYEKYKGLISDAGTSESGRNPEPEYGRDSEPEYGRNPELEILIDKRYMEIPYYKAQCTDVIHGDAKLANILFRDGEVVAFIDFDTIMMGSCFEDVADLIRSCCISEEGFDSSAAVKIAEGYLSIATAYDSEAFIQRVKDSFNKICFELGLRYYIDALSGENIFTDKYQGYRLHNAERLIGISWI